MRKALLVLAAAALAWPAAAAADKLSRADRLGIDRTLDAVIVDGSKREHPAAVRRYLTADMRAGTTPAQWKHGDIPIYPYPAQGRTFHDWTFAYRSGNTVGVDLLLHPERRLRFKVGPILFHIDLQRHGRRWLVSNFVPGAIYTPEGKAQHLRAVPDFSPGASGASGRAKLGEGWFAIPIGILAIAVVLGGGILGFKWFNERRSAEI